MRSLNKRGQIGETMTWVVATVIILVFSFIFLFTVDALSKSKGAFLGVTLFSSGGAVETNQQTLFAVLKKQPDLGSAGASVRIEAILSDLGARGMSCNFETSGISVIKGSWFGTVTMKYAGKEVKFGC